MPRDPQTWFRALLPAVAATLLLATTVSGLGGALIYGVTRPKPAVPSGPVTNQA